MTTNRAVRTVFLLAAFGSTAFAQSAPARPVFEVASIKPSPPPTDPNRERAMNAMMSARPPGWLPTDKARVTVHNRSLLDLIATAYRVQLTQVSGPAWMADARFDIEAKLPDGAPAETVNDMLQSLLEERFGLQVHREEKELPGYALVVAKGGPKLAPATTAAAPPMDEDARKKLMADNMKNLQNLQAKMRAEGAVGGFSTSHWGKKNGTIAELVAHLWQMVQRPVIDMTGLTEKYDLSLDMERTADETQEYAVSQAVAKLGLKLEDRKVPTPVFVVDKVNKTPTEN
jgi:uncharacterized protein (TIGR03435 family)